jgi:tRNA-splicing ligase RtcB
MIPLNLKSDGKVIARVYASQYDSLALDQLRRLSSLDGFGFINAFPDLHAGNDFPVGYVMKTKNMFYPRITGADIGCNVRGYKVNDDMDERELQKCAEYIKKHFTGTKEIPSIGGGNHFFEIAKDNLYNTWFIVHTGSRSVGGETYRELNEELKFTNAEGFNTKSMFFMGVWLAYNHAEKVALDNSKEILDAAMSYFNIRPQDNVITVHNTINVKTDKVYHYKGASYVRDDEYALIPLSMGEGTLLVKSLNTSKLFDGINHGAGRLMTRKKAKETLDTSSLQGINYLSNSVPLDEAPAAYKDISEDMDWLVENEYIKVVSKLKPIVTVKE